jgi:2OG-Fe(II) oxygenase superfamily
MPAEELSRPMTAVLDFDRLELQVDRLHEEYVAGDPYPHIVLDDLLEPDAVSAAVAEFPSTGEHGWKNYLHTNERKYSNTHPETWGPTLREILAALNSPRFLNFVSRLTGIEDLIPDPSLEGGGLHQSVRGGYLNMHADFTVHPHVQDWRRRVNVLLYLNEPWRPEYGGQLELWSTDMKSCVKKVVPEANRMLIFNTDVDSYHGHPEPMQCPEGVSRKSLALYYFTREADPLVRSTDYRARPGDGARSVMIYLDKKMLKAYDWAKRHLGLSDETASRVLGLRDSLRRRPRN